MIFKDRYDPSFWPKSIFTVCMVSVVAVALVLMFSENLSSIAWLKPHQIPGNPLRHILIAVCLLLYLLRLQITVWIFQKRKWTWFEALTISILMSFALYVFAKTGGSNRQSVGAFEGIGLLLYLSGSYINTHSEYARHVWKLKPQNRGRLYTKGLFSLSMHINYFGDIILFTGLAMITHSLSMFVIPLIMALNFVFYIIPSLDRYLENKYKSEFKDYANKTKKLIPMIY